MASTSPTTSDPPLTVKELYDTIGASYDLAWAHCIPQAASLYWLIEQLARNKPAKCLDLGCGTGKPICAGLVAAGHRVLGIDVSDAMLAAARTNVPTGPSVEFRKVDMRDFEPGEAEGGGFDAVTAYFSLLAGWSQEEIRGYFGRIHGWLKPGGVFVFGTVEGDMENVEMKWLGRRIVVSSLDAEEAVEVIRRAGFEVVWSGTSTFTPMAALAGLCEEDEVWEEPHLFVYARKPA